MKKNLIPGITGVKRRVIGLIITVIAFLVGGSYYLYTGKAHNPITHFASEIIEHEIGIDLESFLSDDEGELIEGKKAEELDFR